MNVGRKNANIHKDGMKYGTSSDGRSKTRVISQVRLFYETVFYTQKGSLERWTGKVQV